MPVPGWVANRSGWSDRERYGWRVGSRQTRLSHALVPLQRATGVVSSLSGSIKPGDSIPEAHSPGSASIKKPSALRGMRFPRAMNQRSAPSRALRYSNSYYIT